MVDIFSNDRLDELFMELLYNSYPQDRMYIYRIEDGRPVKPAVLIGEPYPDLLNDLRDKYGSGTYRVLIRRSEKMMLSGTFSILAPINWRRQK